MIVHGIDMMKVNTPKAAKDYENKMKELIPFKNKWFVDPFGRNLNVKITDKRIVYDPRSLGSANEEADKNSKKYMRRVEVTTA